MTHLVPVVSAIAGAAFTVAFCLALGTILLQRLQLEFHRLESSLFAFVSGAACLSLLVFLLCLIRLACLPVFLTLGTGSVAWAVVLLRHHPPRKQLPAASPAWRALFTVVFTAFFVCYLSNAIAPEISPDGSGYHLGNVTRYLRNNGFEWSYHSIYSSLSQGMEMLFLVAFSIGKHPAAAMVHLAFQATLPLLIFCYGRRFGFPRAATFAAIIIYACPVVGIAGISAYNDLAVATLVFAGFYLIEVTNEITSHKLYFLIGLVAGFCFAVKYPAGIALPFALLLTRGKRSLAILTGASILILPWLFRNSIWIGNPFAPFLNAWFPNPYWTAASEHGYLADLRHYPPFKSSIDFIFQLTVLGGLVPGMIGPAFLLLPLCLLALRQPHGRRLLLAAVVFAIPAVLNTEVRFAIPCLPFLALAMGLAMENSPGALPAVALLQAVLCWPSVMDTYCDRLAWRVRGFQFSAAFRPESQTHYIASHVGDFALAPAIHQFVPSGYRIFSFAGRAAAYIDRDIVIGYESTAGLQIQEALETGDSNFARRNGIEYVLVNDSDQLSKTLHLRILAAENGTTLYHLD